ncbi:MAG TPA: FAD-binding protein [Gemmatimonadaceae bacterium]
MTTATTSSDAIELRDRVRDAAGRRLALRVAGRGSWLDANRPVQAEATLDVSGHSGIVEYEPGDLTLTARAGTTLEEIARATAAHGQWLSLDPYGDPTRSSLGATIVTASYGPLAHQFGTPRDMTLGVEFVAGTGDIVRGGGRVVKNVAGFDLTRLVTGSWGTIGVITEATVRLRAIPPVQATLAIDVAGAETEIERLRAALRTLPFMPLAAQLLDATATRLLGAGDRVGALLVRLGGNEEAVRDQREQLRSLGDARTIDAAVWDDLRVAEPARAAVVRFSRRSSMFASTWRTGMRIVERWPSAAYCHGDPGRGVVRIVLPLAEDTSEAELRSALDVSFEGARIYERLPPSLWESLASPSLHGQLQCGVKTAFDPSNVLNPGILGELQ